MTTPQDQVDAITYLGRCGFSAAKIHQLLHQQLGDGAPSDRTVRDIVQRRRSLELDEPWTIATAEPSTIRTVLDVLATLVQLTHGRVTSVTREEADWIVRVAAAGSGGGPVPCWYLARTYAQRARGRTSSERSTVDLDLYLAYAPWRSLARKGNYRRLVEAGVVPRLPPIALYADLEERSYADLEQHTYAELEGGADQSG